MAGAPRDAPRPEPAGQHGRSRHLAVTAPGPPGGVNPAKPRIPGYRLPLWGLVAGRTDSETTRAPLPDLSLIRRAT